jgi:protein NrfD
MTSLASVVTYTVPHLIYWDWRVAADLFFGGVGVGAFLLAVVNSLYYKDKYIAVSKVGAILAPVMVILGLAFMMTELGHPERLWRTVTGFNASSPLSWGGPFQTLMIIVSIIYAFCWVRPISAKVRNAVGIVGIPLALVVGAYHGWLLTILRARPLWNTGPAMITALVGFVITGMAAVLLLLCLLPKARIANSGSPEQERTKPWMIRDFRHLLVGALIIQGLTFFVWWISLVYGPADAQATLTAANEAAGLLFWIGGIGLGVVLPLILQLVEVLLHPVEPGTLNKPLTILTTVLILVGGFVFRYAVVIAGQV